MMLPPGPANALPPIFGSPSDLFVHIQPGERLTLRVGQEEQEVIGPATVRMVGEAGSHPSALPIYVPPGHQIHQIVDENGVLRHLILSPEPSMIQRLHPQGRMNGYGMAGTSTGIHNLITIDRPNKPAKMNALRPVDQQLMNETLHEDASDMDSEEKDRLREMLNCIQSPSLVRVTDLEADLQWQELDTSEAAAPGGPFPQIDASEFSYSVILYENLANNPRFISTYQCSPEQGGNCIRLCKLRPLTDYFVQLKASLEERGIIGEPSKAVHFRTKAPRPSAPMPLRILETGFNYVAIAWNTAVEKTHGVHYYNVYVQLGNEPNTRTEVYTGTGDKAIVGSLQSATRYDIFVSVVTDCGESALSSPLRVETRPEPKPPVPNVQTTTPRTIKFSWLSMPDHKLTLEMCEARNPEHSLRIVKDNLGGTVSSTVIDGLQPATDYKFRFMLDHNLNNKSDWVTVRTATARPPPEAKPETRPVIPSAPFLISRTSYKKMEIGWKYTGPKDKDTSFHLEGAPRLQEGAPPRWKTVYKGDKTQAAVTEELLFFRVQSLVKKNQSSDWSQVLNLPNPIDELPAPPAPGVPELMVVDKNAVLARWKAPADSVDELPSGVSWVIELRRKDANNNIVYCGQESSFKITGLPAQQRVEIQIRKVFLDDSHRVEGAWSPAASISTPKEAPKTPKNVRVNMEKQKLEWTSDEDNTTRFIVRRYKLEDDESECEHELSTQKHECSLGNVEPASYYEYTVQARNESGESEPSDPAVYETKPETPGHPENVTLETVSTSQMVLRWDQPESGGAEIINYIIRVLRDEESISEESLPATAVQGEYNIDDLEADTEYTIGISAENQLGMSDEVLIDGRTNAYPPEAPSLDGDCEATQIRLRWQATSETSPGSPSRIRYRVVKVIKDNRDSGEDDEERQAVVYEGEACSCRIRNLNENSEYRFKICAIDRQVGPGPWSDVYSYSTTVAVPMPLKGPLTPNDSGNGVHQIEWQPCIIKPNNRRYFYSLEVMDYSVPEAAWVPIYEGTVAQYTVRLTEKQKSISVRLRIGRKDSTGKKVYSAPCQAIYLAYNPKPEPAKDASTAQAAPNIIQAAWEWLSSRSFASILVVPAYELLGSSSSFCGPAGHADGCHLMNPPSGGNSQADRHILAHIADVLPKYETIHIKSIANIAFVKTLGKGRFGEVAKYVDNSNGKFLAVKTINLELFKHWSQNISRAKLRCDQFLDNVSRLYTLANSHHRLANVIGVYADNSKIMVLTEFCGGGSVKDQLEKGPLNEEDAIRYLFQTIEALHYLHSQSPQFVHSDIKATNILITSDDSVKLSNFGLVRDLCIGGYGLAMAAEVVADARGRPPYGEFFIHGTTLKELEARVKGPAHKRLPYSGESMLPGSSYTAQLIADRIFETDSRQRSTAAELKSFLNTLEAVPIATKSRAATYESVEHMVVPTSSTINDMYSDAPSGSADESTEDPKSVSSQPFVPMETIANGATRRRILSKAVLYVMLFILGGLGSIGLFLFVAFLIVWFIRQMISQACHGCDLMQPQYLILKPPKNKEDQESDIEEVELSALVTPKPADHELADFYASAP
ncbi:unnamed protein product, partial [Mesorhabditis spiculigera]